MFGTPYILPTKHSRSLLCLYSVMDLCKLCTFVFQLAVSEEVVEFMYQYLRLRLDWQRVHDKKHVNKDVCPTKESLADKDFFVNAMLDRLAAVSDKVSTTYINTSDCKMLSFCTIFA